MEPARRALDALEAASLSRRGTLFSPALKDLDDKLAALRPREEPREARLTRCPWTEISRTSCASRRRSPWRSPSTSERWRRSALPLVRLMAERLPKQDLDGLAAASLAYRAGRISNGAYYGALENLLARRGMGLAAHPAFDKYVRYVLAADRIDASRLFDELQRVQASAVLALAPSPAARELFAARQDLRLAGRLLRHELTSDEWVRCGARLPEIHRLAETLGVSGLPSLATLLAACEDFYRAASGRSKALVDNLLAKLEAVRPAAPGNLSVLVAGGFHTPGLAEELARRGASRVGRAQDGEGGRFRLRLPSRSSTAVPRRWRRSSWARS